MPTLSVSEARKHFASLLSELSASRKPITITNRGRPIARIIPCGERDVGEESHSLRGLPIEVSPDFDEPIEGLWEALEE